MTGIARNSRALGVLLLCCLHSWRLAAGQDISEANKADLLGFFDSIDTDHDGQIEDRELRQYLLDNNLNDENDEATIQSIIALTHNNVEAADDADDTVSRAELSAHISSLATHHIVEWVSHGLQLPQYAPSFKKHSITAYDLPHLVRDGGKTLQEMGVTMALHRQRVLRGIKRLLLGLGSPPSSPIDVHCVNQHLLAWAPPLQGGSPPFHKYVVEVLDGGSWRVVNGALTSDDRGVRVGHEHHHHHHQEGEGSGTVYRVRAWNEYGMSEPVVVECENSVGGQRAWWSGAWVSTLGVVVLSIVARSAYMLGWLDHTLFWSKSSGERHKESPTAAVPPSGGLPRVASAVSSAASDQAHPGYMQQPPQYTYSASFGSTGSGERFAVPDESSQGAKKSSVCAFDECTAKTLLPVLRIKARGTHYCGVCQRYYCAVHTAVSAHGASGDCGVESKCVCIGCLDEMDSARRAEVMKRRRGSLSERRGFAASGGSTKSG